MKAAVTLHKDRKLPSPHHAQKDYITIVFKAVKKYEKEYDCHSMIDDEMIHHMESLRSNFPSDSWGAFLVNWVYLGWFVGYRGIEWCQTSMGKYDKILHPNWNRPASYASILDAIEFSNYGKQPLDDLTGLTPDNTLYFRPRFKRQKNDRNFKIVPYDNDLEKPKFCPVNVIFRIVQLTQRLNLPTEDPLAVF